MTCTMQYRSRGQGRPPCLGVLPIVLTLAVASSAPAADVRVQDIARLQGQRTNKLMGYGLVVGLNGTGDGEKYAPTMRALMRMHERFHAPVLSDQELKGNKSIALVAVEAEVPEFGGREGQTVDVTVTVIGAAKSLKGGQLLTTPLQYAMFDDEDPETQHILGLAGGRVTTIDDKETTRAIVRQGATLEADFIYSFIEDDHVTLVLDDEHAGWTWSQMVARALNHELTGGMKMLERDARERDAGRSAVACAVGPKYVQVQVPQYELSAPGNYVSRVLQTPLFMLPEQAARVVVNRATKTVSFTGAVRVSPATLTVAGLGTISVGKPDAGKVDPKATTQPAKGADKAAEPGPAVVDFSELVNALAAVKATPEQIIAAIESLHRSGSLHAQLVYE